MGPCRIGDMKKEWKPHVLGLELGVQKDMLLFCKCTFFHSIRRFYYDDVTCSPTFVALDKLQTKASTHPFYFVFGLMK